MWFTFEASSKFDAAFSSLVIKYKRNLGDHSMTSDPISITVFSFEINVRFSSKLSIKIHWMLELQTFKKLLVV